jgi:hypothetical protein
MTRGGHVGEVAESRAVGRERGGADGSIMGPRQTLIAAGRADRVSFLPQASASAWEVT